MNMKISKRDAALLLGLLGVLTAGLVYYLVFMSYSEKTEALNVENDTIKKRVDVLQEIANQYDHLLESTEANRAATGELLERFPSDIREEDAIMLAVRLQGQAPFETIASLGIGSPLEMINTTDINTRVDAVIEERLGAELAGTEGDAAQPAAPVSEETEAAESGEIVLDGGYILYKRDIQLSGTATYEGFKNAVKMLAERKDKTQLAVSAAYDMETGLVSTQISMGTYYMTGTGKLYQPPNIPFISQGTSNIFGTIQLTGGRISRDQTSEDETEETEGAEESEASEE